MRKSTIPSEPVQQVLQCARAAAPFASSLGQAFVSIPLGPEAQQVIPIRSPRFYAWLADNFYREFSLPPNASALRNAVRQLEAGAWFADSNRPAVARRLAAHGSNVILDLYDELGQVVEITPHGWRVVSGLGYHFANARNSRPLPAPIETETRPSARLSQLRAILNLSQRNWSAVLAWTLAALRPSGPYPILILRGPPNSGKSTCAALLRTLVDPNAVPFQPLPRTERQLLQLAHSHWVLAFDHVRRISVTISDALAGLSSGAVLGLRETPGDVDPLHLLLQRPVILTAPSDEHPVHWISRSAIAANSIVVDQPAIASEQLRPRQHLQAEFDAAHPVLLSAFCDAISAALAQPADAPYPAVRRFAEQAAWIASAFSALDESPGTLRAVLNHPTPLEKSITTLLSREPEWNGTGTELLKALPGAAPSASALMRILNALDPIEFRIDVNRVGHSRDRRITLTSADGIPCKVPSANPTKAPQTADYKTARI